MVGMTGITPHHALERFKAVTASGHAAAGAVDEGHDAVHIRILRQLIRPERIGDPARRRGRTVYRGHNGDVVAGTHLTVVAAVAHEGIALILRNQFHGAQVGAEFVSGFGVAKGHILAVNMVARRDVLRCVSDKLRIFADFAPRWDRRGGDLMT